MFVHLAVGIVKEQQLYIIDYDFHRTFKIYIVRFSISIGFRNVTF